MSLVFQKLLNHLLVLPLILFSLVSQAQVTEAGATDFFELELGVPTTDENLSDANEQDNEFSWQLNGSLSFQTHYGDKNQLNEFAFRRKQSEFTQARTTLRLSTLGQLFQRVNFEISGIGFYDSLYHHHIDDASDEEFKAMGDELSLRDAYIEFETIDNLWLKIGRQIIAFGESEFIQILDMANPRDERELGLVDLEDARLPVLATRLSYVGQRWGVDLALIQEFINNRYSGKGADFDPYIGLRNAVTIVSGEEPEVNIHRPGILFRNFWSHAYGDIHLIYSKGFDHSPVLDLSPQGGSVVYQRYPEVSTYGVAANWITGSWLFKGELAKKENMYLAKNNFSEELSLGYGMGELYKKKNLLQSMVGVEYSAYQDAQLSAELVITKVLDYENSLAVNAWDRIFLSRIAFEFFRDTANLEFIWSHWLEGDSDSLRLAYNYDFSDEISFTGGYIDFMAENNRSILYPYQNNDRWFGSVSYSF